MCTNMEPDPGISDKKLEANRQNSLKSTGPTSIEGKVRSAMNALKHGLTAEQIVLPNEDPEAYDALRQKWLDDYPDADAGQLALIEIAVRNIWMLDRAARHKRAMSAERMRHAADAFEIAMVFATCDEAHPEPWTYWNECHQARLGVERRFPRPGK